MISETIPQVKSLPLAKKRALIVELVGEVFGEPVEQPDLAKAFEARLAHYRRHPKSGKTWAEGKAGLRRKK